MEPRNGYENTTIIKQLPISHLTTPFTSYIRFPIQTCHPGEKEGDRDIEPMTQCTFFELIAESGINPFLLALIRDSSGCFAAYDAVSLKEWVLKKEINPLSQYSITHSSVYRIRSILGDCEFLKCSNSVEAILSLDQNGAAVNDAEKITQQGESEAHQEEEIVKELDISHLTKPFSSIMKFSIQRYNRSKKKLEREIEAVSKRSFLELIKAKESCSLSFVLAVVEDTQGKFAVYDASSLSLSAQKRSANLPLKEQIKRISWYTIDRLADEFRFLGDSTSMKVSFIDLFILANAGDSQACYDLGCLYEEGKGVAKDLTRANHFFTLALRGGNTQAFLRTVEDLIKEGKISKVLEFFNKVKVQEAVEIAVCYIDLFYFEVISFESIRYDLLMAIAKSGSDSRVFYLLGRCLKEGLGVHASSQEAIALFEKAAPSCSKACYELGVFAVESSDLERAKKYLTQAGEGHVPAQLLLANVLIFSENSSKGAIKILNRLCERKVKEAYLPAAKIYLGGKGIDPNFSRAYELLKKASEFDEEACRILERFGPSFLARQERQDLLSLLPNISVETNDLIQGEKTVRIYEKLYKMNVPVAFYQLHRIYRDGLCGKKQDSNEAHKYFSALELVDPASYYLLKLLYSLPYSSKVKESYYSPQQARSFLELACEDSKLKKVILNRYDSVCQEDQREGTRNKEICPLIPVFTALLSIYGLNRIETASKKNRIQSLEFALIEEYMLYIREYFANSVKDLKLVDKIFQIVKNLQKKEDASERSLRNFSPYMDPFLYLYKLCADAGHSEAVSMIAKEFSLTSSEIPLEQKDIPSN